MSRRVFLTGASGFLGAELAKSFTARGYELHAMVREGSDRTVLEALGARLHAADLRDAGGLARALESAAVDGPLDVVHCAAVISYRSRDAALQREVNVEGTRHLIDACRAKPVRRVLHMSSIVAVGHSLDVVVVNPGAVFGPAGESSNSAYMLRRVAEGRVAAAPPGMLAPVGVRDVAEGCALALEGGARGRRYLLCESNMSHLELLRLVAAVCDVPPPRRRVPPALWKGIEGLARGLDRMRPLQRLTPQSLRMLAHSFVGNAARARTELGWRPHPIRGVIEEAVDALGMRNPPPSLS